MKRILLAALASAALATPAFAQSYDEQIIVGFTGVLDTTGNYSPNLNAPSTPSISGSFVLDSASGNILSFNIAGVSAQGAYQSVAAFSGGSGNVFSSLYEANIFSAGGSFIINQFALTLSALNTSFDAADSNAIALLLDANALATNLDTTASDPNCNFCSTFSYSLTDGSQNPLTKFTADVSSLTVAVPEPTSMALIGTGLLGLLGARRRRRG